MSAGLSDRSRTQTRARTAPQPIAAPRRSFALALTAAMPLALLAGWLAADALQPPEYSPLRQTISVEVGHAGTDRWVGTAGLLAMGVGYLLCVFALPLSRWRGRLGILATGICGVGVALCPEATTGPTTGHKLFSVLGSVLLAAGPLFTLRVTGRHDGAAPITPLALRPPVAAAACVVFTALNAYLVYELNYGTAAGFAERLAVTVETAWPVVVTLSCRWSRTARSFRN